MAAQYRGFGTFNKIGSSTWTVTGASTFAGPLNVNGGTLSVSGNITSASAVTVNSGGTLAGTGTVGATAVASGGTLQAGSGTAGSSLNVTGTLGMNAGSTYAVNINAATASFANVSGIATLGGATINVIFAPGSTFTNKRYTILYAGSISGTFGAAINTNLSSNVVDTISYDATHAYLNMTLNYANSSPLNGNQSNVGNALTNFFNANGAIPLAFTLPTPTGLSQASGQPGASTAQAGMTGVGQFINGVFDGAFGDGPGQAGATGFAQEESAANAYAAKRNASREVKEAYAAVTPRDRRAPSLDARWAVWASAYGGNSRVNGDSRRGHQYNDQPRLRCCCRARVIISQPDTQAGFALGGAGSSFDIANNFGGGTRRCLQCGGLCQA